MTTDGTGAFTRATGRSLEDGNAEHQRRYREFQLELIRRHCGPSVLEVGAGLGDFAAGLTGLDRLVVTDVDPGCVAGMAARFSDRPEVEAQVLDLDDPPEVVPPVSTVVAINVLEHIEDDVAALRRLAAMVEPGGNIVLWVPAHEWLYGDFDRAVGHVRRYTAQSLATTIDEAGLGCSVSQPVNMLGALAWWVAVRRGGVSSPRPRLLRAYDTFVVPVTRALESRVTPPFGQSVLAVASVPGSR